MQDTGMRLYAVRNKKTGKFVSNITNPKHKFWERRGSCESALEKYAIRYEYLKEKGGYYRGTFYPPEDLEMVELICCTQSKGG